MKLISAPSKSLRSRIDYILYRPTSAFKMVMTEIIEEGMMSDHFPGLSILERRFRRH